MNNKIPSLSKGDTVGIVAPSRAISLQELEPALNLLKQWGLNVKLGQHLFDRYHQFAGNDSDRIADLQSMIDNPVIKAVWCARGGYGLIRLIDRLNLNPLKNNPKWICGYSDVTVLHETLQTIGIPSLHCTMPVNINSQTDENSLSVRTMKN